MKKPLSYEYTDKFLRNLDLKIEASKPIRRMPRKKKKLMHKLAYKHTLNQFMQNGLP